MEYMHFIYDGVAVLFILVMIKIFFDKGILSCLVQLLSSLVAFVVAWFFSGPLSQWVYHEIVERRIVDYIDVKVLAPAGLDSVTVGAGNFWDALGIQLPFADLFEKLLEKLPFVIQIFMRGQQPDNAATQIAEHAATAQVTLAQAITDVAITPTALTLFASLAFLLLFGITIFFCHRFGYALREVNDVPVVGGLNRMLGGIFGGVEAVLILFLIGLVIQLALPMAGENLYFSREIIDQTILLRRIIYFVPWPL